MWPGPEGKLSGARGEGLTIEASGKTQSRSPLESLPVTVETLDQTGHAVLSQGRWAEGAGRSQSTGSGQGPAGQKIPEGAKDSGASYL